MHCCSTSLRHTLPTGLFPSSTEIGIIYSQHFSFPHACYVTRPHSPYFINGILLCIARSEPGGTRWRTGGEVKGKLANGVGSQYFHAISESGLSSITQADVHTSAVSSRLNWRPHRFKWTRPFRGKTKSGFCACAITFRTSYNIHKLRTPPWYFHHCSAFLPLF